MKKVSYLFASILTLLLVGCQPAVEKTVEPVAKPAEKNVSSFDATKLIPATVLSNEIYSLDFNNDGVEEKVIHYINKDDLEGIYCKRDHVTVYQLTNNNWESIYSYVLPPDNDRTDKNNPLLKEEPDVRIQSISVVDVANDGNQELLVKNENNLFGNWRFNSYEIIGERSGKISILDLPMEPEKRNIPLSFYGRILDANCVNGTIVEKWGGTCEGGTNPCYTFEFDISYTPVDGTWTISKAQNVQQVPEEWNAYQKEYEDAGEWTGTLPF
jgi:hypothetical protein